MSRWTAAALSVTLVAELAAHGALASTRDPFAAFRQAIVQFQPSTAQFHHRKRHLAKAASASPVSPTPVPTMRSGAAPPSRSASPEIADRPEAERTEQPSIRAGEKTVAAETKAVPEPRPRPETPPPLQIASLPTAAPDAGIPMSTATIPALVALGADARPLDPIEKGPCTVLDPVAVASLEDGAVALTEKVVLNQRMAETVARWVHDDLEPAALSILGERLTGLRVIDSYDCRGVNGVVGANLSQHGFANAIDVAAFRIGNRWITVGGDKKDQLDDARFLDAARYSGCARFMTVIGPGLDLHHRNHFHLDLGPHGKSGKAKFCQ